jgi:hypothetical protein
MKTFYKLIFFFLGIGLIVVLYQQYFTGGENLPKSFDYGRIENNIYINDFFGMQVELPGSWVVLSQQEIKSMNQKGHSLYSSDENKADSALGGGDEDIANLLSLFRYPRDSKKLNYSFNIVAQINRDSTIKSGKDALLLLKQILNGAEVKFEFDKEIYKHKFGINNFYVLETKVQISGIEMLQEYYIGILNGFTLSIVMNYFNQEQKNELHNIIDKIKFRA